MENLSLVVNNKNGTAGDQAVIELGVPPRILTIEQMIMQSDQDRAMRPIKLIWACANLALGAGVVLAEPALCYAAFHFVAQSYVDAVTGSSGGGMDPLGYIMNLCFVVAFFWVCISYCLLKVLGRLDLSGFEPGPPRITDLRLPEIRRDLKMIMDWYDDVQEYNAMRSLQGTDAKEIQEVFAALKNREPEVQQIIQHLDRILTNHPLGTVTQPNQHEQRLRRLKEREAEAKQRACLAKAEHEIDKLG